MCDEFLGRKQEQRSLQLVPPRTERPKPAGAFAVGCVSGRPGLLAWDAE